LDALCHVGSGLSPAGRGGWERGSGQSREGQGEREREEGGREGGALRSAWEHGSMAAGRVSLSRIAITHLVGLPPSTGLGIEIILIIIRDHPGGHPAVGATPCSSPLLGWAPLGSFGAPCRLDHCSQALVLSIPQFLSAVHLSTQAPGKAQRESHGGRERHWRQRDACDERARASCRHFFRSTLSS